jgi:hypothetical protein
VGTRYTPKLPITSSIRQKRKPQSRSVCPMGSSCRTFREEPLPIIAPSPLPRGFPRPRPWRPPKRTRSGVLVWRLTCRSARQERLPTAGLGVSARRAVPRGMERGARPLEPIGALGIIRGSWPPTPPLPPCSASYPGRSRHKDRLRPRPFWKRHSHARASRIVSAPTHVTFWGADPRD